MRLLAVILIMNALPVHGLPLIKICIQEEAKISIEVKPPLAVFIQNHKDSVFEESEIALREELSNLTVLFGLKRIPFIADTASPENGKPDRQPRQMEKERLAFLLQAPNRD